MMITTIFGLAAVLSLIAALLCFGIAELLDSLIPYMEFRWLYGISGILIMLGMASLGAYAAGKVLGM